VAVAVVILVVVVLAVEAVEAVFLNMIKNQGFQLLGLPDKLVKSLEWVGKLSLPLVQGLARVGVNLASRTKPVDIQVWTFSVNTEVLFVVRQGVLLSEQDMRVLTETLFMSGTKTERQPCMHIYLESMSSQDSVSRLDKPWGGWGQLDEPRVHIFISR
jgi:hypothetical protein